MRGKAIGLGCVIMAATLWTAPLWAQEPGDFEWSWEDGTAGKEGAAAAENQKSAKLDPETYNQLLKENLTLRRKLQETDRGAETIREENAKLQGKMTSLQSQITASTEEVARLKREATGLADPDKVVALEAELAAAEAAKAKLAKDLAVLTSRAERTASAPSAPRESGVKPGSDLFVALESENAELRTQLTDLEAEKQKVVKQLREVEAEVDEKAGLETEMASISSETEQHKLVIRKLLERIPALEQDLAETQSREREKTAELTQRERELRALKVELDRREHRLKKAERVAALLAKTRSEVQVVGTTRQRDVHYNMGVVFANRGQYKEAEREYLRALRQDPTDADTHYNLAVLYDQNLKKYREAASHYRRYLNLRPNAPDVNEVRLWISAAEMK